MASLGNNGTRLWHFITENKDAIVEFCVFFPCQVMRHAGLLRKASHAHKEGVSFGSLYISENLPHP